ncbi:MAG: glycosyltransferase family 1 protein [Ferruginibacter sp.]
MVIGIEAQRLFRRKKHGMEIVALEIIRQLQLLDHKNQYIIYSKKDEDINCISPTANFSINAESEASYPVWEQVYLPGAVKKTRPDILHCTANTAPLSGKTPLIITIHDVIYLESINFSGSSYQNFGNIYRRLIVPKVAKKAVLILTVSEYEKKIIAERLHIPEDKIRVIYNGANPQFKPISDNDTLQQFKSKYRLPEKFLLHFGNTAPKKNTTGVLHAYKIYRNAVAEPLPLVITDCDKDYIKDLLKQQDASSLIEHIQILDYVPFDSIPCLYNLATVFLYPSHRESFGMPVIEAMACGVPVITSDTSALPEIAGGAACLVNPANPNEISEQIVRLLCDKDLYDKKRESGFKNAALFSWKHSAEKTIAVYEEVMRNI